MAYVVDDDPAILESTGWLLRSLDIPCRCFSSAGDFLATYQPEAPGCLILDVRMPGMTGLELQDVLAERGQPIPIIFITAHGDVPIAVRAMKSGAVEFLPKPYAQEDLSQAIRRAFAMALQQQRRSEAGDDLEGRLAGLTPREREILRLLIAGKSAKEVGKLLHISPRTAEFHRRNILEKMNADSLICLAAQVGTRLEGPG